MPMNPYIGMSGPSGTSGGGFMSSAAGGAASAGSGMFQDLMAPTIGEAGNKISDWIFGKKKVPAPPTGQQLGLSAHDYYDAAFPGTTPWERLGTSNPAGGVAETAMQGISARNIASSQQRVERTHNSMQNSIARKEQKLTSKKLDIESRKTDIEADTLKMHQGKVPAEIGALNNNNLLRTLQNMYPDWLLNAAVGVGGVAGIAGKLMGPARRLARPAADGVRRTAGNMGKWASSFNKGKKGYINPYSGKKVYGK